MLRATTACNFSSLIWPAGSAPAALTSLLFDPPEPQIIGKTSCFAAFLPFRAPGFFCSDFLFLDLLSSCLLFFDSSHLCFSFAHVVGSLTSKFPSVIFASTYDFNCFHKVYYVFICFVVFSHVATWCGEHTSGEGISSDKSHAYVFFLCDLNANNG